jgi:hypothetical protein
VRLAGLSAEHYNLGLRGASQIASVDGAEVVKLPAGASALRVSFPAGRSEYKDAAVVIHFVATPGVESRTGTQK